MNAVNFQRHRGVAGQSKSLERISGFTLVEIMVVLAIIAVLAAIIFGIFSRVREKGRSAMCQGNLHQLALGIQQYVADNSGRYPQAFNPDATTWAHHIFPYIKNAQVFRCPTVSRPIEPGIDPLTIGSLVYRYNNLRLQRIVTDSSGHSGYVEGNTEMGSTLSDHATTIFLHVCDPPALYQEENTSEEILGSCGLHFLIGHDVRHHSGGTNWSFLDGHVKWLTPEQMAELSCSNPLGRPGPTANP